MLELKTEELDQKLQQREKKLAQIDEIYQKNTTLMSVENQELNSRLESLREEYEKVDLALSEAKREIEELQRNDRSGAEEVSRQLESLEERRLELGDMERLIEQRERDLSQKE